MGFTYVKKNIIFFVLTCFLLGIMGSSAVFADDINEGEPYADVFLSITAGKNTDLPVVNATAVIVMDLDSGRVLYSKNAESRKSIASTTKIMSAIIVLENGNLDDIVTVSKRAAGIRGSSIDLSAGEKLTLRELLYGMMLNSGNDAAIAVAEHIGGSVENFVGMMNEKAEELGLTGTSFKSPHGLDATGHYSTAKELALLTRYALKNPEFSKIVSTLRMQIQGRSLYNTNEMLGNYPGVDGVKTGYTGQAGRCLVCSATRNNWRVISVVLGCPTRTVRADSSRKILDYAFNNYKPYTLLNIDEKIRNVPVIKGKMKEVPAIAVEDIKIPLRSDELTNLETEIELPESLEAPVKSNIEIGSIRFLLEGNVIASSALKTGEDVERKGVLDYFGEIMSTWGEMMRFNNL